MPGEEINMIIDILTKLGTSTVVMVIAVYVLKNWIRHQFEKNKTSSDHQLNLTIETIRAEWAKEVAKLNVHETYLHQRRVELIEKIYAKMVDAELSLQNFLVSWWAHSNKDELIERGHFSEKNFSDDSTEQMKKRGLEFCKMFIEINSMLHKNALYFDNTFIERVINAYKPFSDTILAFEYNDIPNMPEEFKDIIMVGKVPRRTVIDLFRVVLGVK